MKKQIKNGLIVLTMIFVGAMFSMNVTAQVIAGTGNYTGAPGFDRGFQATMYCGNWPESWLRGSAFLDRNTGILTMHVGLETDATHAGPKGQILVYVSDAYGNLLARVASSEVGMGGKPPGGAVIKSFQASLYLGPDIANRATRITVVPNLTGFIDRLWNVNMDKLMDAAGYIQQFAMFFF